ncbi:MAG: hypothetical protein GWN01_02580 [Nitrosopumilaceae archaeon]|nr:hypothetical protein [Nitrosopumilaceae archaeon]NIT99853.1 hypothetical protein [Nitrosopumilaceae archaeon]NIU86216.1 hypothetical protein [Nitrosopumilaceae archaeon]NIV64977.1 hypothetical protein [Nitrosopumilaceae archaeon]NIX60456.1 hypothetical protein [Nitrosopumilaceae archaeon]
MKKFKNLILILSFICIGWTGIASAGQRTPERFYQLHWCKEHNGTAETRLEDGTRVDCLTNSYAIEFDFAYKWAEAVGQVAHYAIMTNRNPGIVLILEDKNDLRYIIRLLNATRHSTDQWRFWFIWARSKNDQ